jgi:histone acetyltransferase (RNA polymerase elongator complex component)
MPGGPAAQPFVIPFFLNHQGCPHRCVYCDQRLTGGQRPEPLTPLGVTIGLEAGLASPRLKPGTRVEAAFFGGTFTNLPKNRQMELLEAVAPFCDQGRVQGLRLSTRPDALADEQVHFLKIHGVTNVEIGAQSLDDQVLLAAGRGHTAADTRQAAQRLKKAGIRVGLQLLPGLPGEDRASRVYTLSQALEIGPQEARIYPLLVMKGTPLAGLFQQGAYLPLTLNQAVAACADLLARLVSAGINVIRTGLQNEPELEKNLVAGPYHPAFGHLVKSEVFRRAMAKALALNPAGNEENVLLTSPRELSTAVGQNRSNLDFLKRHFSVPNLAVRPDPRLAPGSFSWRKNLFHVYQ